MKNGLNKVTLVGFVGDDPKANDSKENGLWVKFPIATSEYYKDKQGTEQKSTEWHNVIAWRKTAELIRDYVKKGDPLYVEGKIRTNSWEDKEGVKRYSTDIHCNQFLFLSSKNS